MLKPHLHTVLVLCILLLFHAATLGQGVVPVQRYAVPRLLERINTKPSFSYSLRKIQHGYTGYAVTIRRSTDNAEADVSFDASGIVSNASDVKVTAVGTSTLTLGQTLSFSTFKGSRTIYVKTWYDQGGAAYHATQTTRASQPTLVMNTAGAANKPSIVFNGSQYLVIAQPVQNIVADGIRGSFLLWMKPTANTAQESFGYWQSANAPYANWRWSFHVNWNDGNLYFDAAENCCAANRSISNSANINLYGQYSFVRGDAYKTVRINGAATGLNNAAAAATGATGGNFCIGWSTNGVDGAYYGNITEVLMFPTDLSVASLVPLEADQINYWSN